MKPRSNPFFRPASFVAALALSAVPALAAPLYWDGNDTTANADGGSGIWNTTTTNWDTATTGGTDSAWGTFGNTNVANFGGTGGTVTLGANLGATGAYPNSINVTAGNYVIDQAGFDLSFRGSAIIVSSGATLEIKGGTIPLLNNGSLSVSGTNALKISSKISDTTGIAVTKVGGGDVTLTNDTNDFTGNLFGQNGGNLYISSIKNSGVASAAGAGSIVGTGINNAIVYTGTGDSTNRTFSLFGGGDDALKNNGTSGALVWTGAFTNTKTGSSFLRFSGTNTATNEFRGNLVNSGSNTLSVSKEDAGTWQLSGNNSFTGATAVSAGTLIANHANALGSTTGSTSVTGNAQLILTGGIAVGAEALTLNSGATASWNGQTGAALRNYSGTNSWAGTISLGQNTTIAANSGTTLTVSGAISGGFNLTKADSGTLTLSGANTYTGTTNISAGTLQISGSSGSLGSGSYANTISIASGALLQYSSSTDQTLSGAITGAGALTKDTSSTSTLTISSASTAYTGATTVNAGTLKLVNATGFAGATTVGASGILELNSTNGTVDNWLSPNWTISGTGTINKTGTGWVDLQNANALTGFNGTLNIQQGTFGPGYGAGKIGSDTSTMTVNVSSGALFDIRATGLGAVVKIDKLTGTGTVGTTYNNGATFTVGTGGGSSQFDGTIVGNGTNGSNNQPANPNSTALKLIKAGSGKFTLTNTNTFTGGTAINAGTLQFGKLVSQPASGAVAVGTGATLAVNLGGTGEWTTGTSGHGTIGGLLAGLGGQSGGTVTYTGNVALGFDTTNAASTQTYSNAIGTVGTTLGITKLGTGTLTLSGVNTYTGTTTIAAGILKADRADVAGVSGALGNGGSISFTGGTLQYSANSAATDYSTRILNSASAIKLDTNGQNVTLGTALSSTNTAGLTKEGAGQLDLKMSNAAQYTGTTTINGGTLKFTQSAAEFDRISSSSININNGASLVIFSNVGGLNRTTINNDKTFTFGNTGGGSIVYDQGSHLWQSSTGKFVTTGGTQNTISSANYGFINPQNSHTVNFDVADGTDAVDLLVSVAIGSGNYTKSGEGTLSITSFSTLGGGAAQPNLTINAGTFDVGGTARLTTVGQSTGVVTSNILNNGVYRHSSSGAQTLSGVMSGTGALTQNGSGTLTLSASNSYTGTTSVNVGTLVLGDAATDTFATTAVTVASGATLGGSGTIAGTVTVTGKIAPGNSIGTIHTGAVTWKGAASAGTNTDWNFELGSGNTSDKLNITGNFTKDTSLGSVFNFNFLGSAFTGVFTLAQWTGSSTFSAGNFSYSNLGVPSGTFTISGSTLQFTAVPEPTSALAGLMLGAGLLRRRRKA